MTHDECHTRRAFVPSGCDQQGRLTPSIEPAHAASEISDDEKTDDEWHGSTWPEELRGFVWAAAVVAVVAACVLPFFWPF